jgi:hypothetical protein
VILAVKKYSWFEWIPNYREMIFYSRGAERQFDFLCASAVAGRFDNF